MSNIESNSTNKPDLFENLIITRKVSDLIPKIVHSDESDFRPIKDGEEVDPVSVDNRIINPGERYYDGGTVSKIAGEKGISMKSPMSAAEYVPGDSTQNDSVETEWVVIKGEMTEVPKNKVYRGGTAR